jgi:hypothetical protein
VRDRPDLARRDDWSVVDPRPARRQPLTHLRASLGIADGVPATKFSLPDASETGADAIPTFIPTTHDYQPDATDQSTESRLLNGRAATALT